MNPEVSGPEKTSRSWPGRKLGKVLIANRGEIAVRIARAAAALGIESVAVYARDDAGSPHRWHADHAVALSQAGAAAYLDAAALIDAALGQGCDCIHPGYGFLSENADFARRCESAGLTFVGPRPAVLDLFGDKAAARRHAVAQDVPVARGLSAAATLEEVQAFMASLGADARVVIKAIAGGGGRGLRIVEEARYLTEAYAGARSEALAAFGNGELYVEELIAPARHVEVQVIGDTDGAVAHLHERECSLQRRQQKLVEFAPAPGLSPAVRDSLCGAALRLARSAGVHTLCTFEFLVDRRGRFVFMEANPRLQVEHTVTEAVMDIDLVRTQFLLAAGATLQSLRLTQQEIPAPRGLAVQLRINMERIDAEGQALPGNGRISAFDPPGGAGLRIDTHARAGYAPSPRFDSLLAKLIVHVPSGDADELSRLARRALLEFRIEGPPTNIDFLAALLGDADVAAGDIDTRYVERNGPRLARAMKALPARRAPPSERAEEPAEAAKAAEAQEAASDAGEAPADALAVPAPLGGVIVRLHVAAGDEVQFGQSLAVIEAMKMEHTVSAATSGVVVALAAGVGDAVTAGRPVLYLREQDTTAGPMSNGDPAEDPAATARLDEVLERRRALLDAARPRAVAKQRARGALTARERIGRLCDPDSFVEMGGLIHAENAEDAPADGIIAGSGRIAGRPVMVFAQDFSVMGGSSGHLGRTKLLRTLTRARINGMPMLMLFDGGGHRIQDGQNSRQYAGSTTVFQEFARLSGWVPIAAAVLGAGFAANTNYCAMADFVVMVRGLAEMGLAGPALVKAGTGEAISGQALGGAPVQVDRTGLAHLGVDDETQAFEALRTFISYLPANAGLPPPALLDFDSPDGAPLRTLVPANTRKSYDMRRVVERIADTGSCFEIQPTFGANILTTFARLAGRPIGIIANQPLVLGGMMDSAAAEKTAHFIAVCDAYGLPLVYLLDIPGMAIGSAAEKTNLGRRSAKMLFELGLATVPRASVVIRKGYGLGYVAMCGGRGFEPDVCLAWPTAEICAMSIEGSVDVAYRKQFVDAPDPLAKRQEIIDGIRARVSALQAAEGFGIDDVVDPADTRRLLIDAFAQAPARRQSTMPPKKRSIAPI